MRQPFRTFSKAGMTTIELVVVFAIFAALATTVLFNYRDFSTNVKLQNLTQDIALQIRQTQNRSVSGAFPPLTDDAQIVPLGWIPSYGIYFSSEPTKNDRFVLFFDKSDGGVPDKQFNYNDILNGVCNVSDPNSECLDVIRMTGGETIQEICFNEFTSSDCTQANDAHITFTRPFTRPFLSFTGLSDITASDVRITIASTTGQLSFIIITTTGQIIVE